MQCPKVRPHFPKCHRAAVPPPNLAAHSVVGMWTIPLPVQTVTSSKKRYELPSKVQNPLGHPAQGTCSFKVPAGRFRPHHHVRPVLLPLPDLHEHAQVLPVIGHEPGGFEVEQAGDAAVGRSHNVPGFDVAVGEDGPLGAGKVVLDVFAWAVVLAVSLDDEASKGVVGVVLVLAEWGYLVAGQAALRVHGGAVDGGVETVLGWDVLGSGDFAQGHDNVPKVSAGQFLLDGVEAGPHLFESVAGYLLHVDSSRAGIVEIGLIHLGHWNAWCMLSNILHRSALADSSVVALLHQHAWLKSEEPRASLPTGKVLQYNFRAVR